MASSSTPLSEAEFTSAVELLRGLIPAEELTAYSLERSPATVYTTLVTLWMLTLQRLGGGKSMAAVIRQVLNSHVDLLPDNKRVREGTLSQRTGSFSVARSRIPLELVEAFAERVSHSLIERSTPWFAGRRTFLLDGSTVTLAPTDPLREVYPPATNQYGETVWPVMLLTVAHELASGCAMIPEFGAMYGPDNTSEARQAAALGRRIPRGSLIFADAGLGIFSVAYAMHAAGHDVLFRLTKTRFKALLRRAVPSATGDGARVSWTPSAKDRKTNPELSADAGLEIELHEVELKNGERVYLATTLRLSTVEAGELYARRYDVEHDLRDLKVTLALEKIRAKSDEMVRKELLCGIVAYNLVMELRRAAAKIAKVEPRRLSFTGVWETMKSYLLHHPPASAAEWQVRYEKALRSASRATLPNRPGRSYPRRAHPRRPKSTKFMQQRSKNKPPTQPPESTK